MKNVLLQTATKLDKRRKNRRNWQYIVRTLAMVVVFCTTYALILPAITIQSDPICGIEEHVHTEECFTQQTKVTLGCTQPEDAVVVHRHGEYCRDGEGNLICTLAEISVHTHEDACYQQEDVLNCPVTHVHTEDCVKTELVLSCCLEEVEAHTHGEGCFEEQSVQVCTISEGHVHEEGCFGTQSVNVCGLEESEEHTHGEDCFAEESTLTCTTPENHTHSEECFAQQNVQTCTLEETEGHAHSEGCYTEQQTTCGEVSVDEHTHDDSCYQKSGSLICGKDEILLHTHGEECHDAEGNLVCQLPVIQEHVHSESCIVTETLDEYVQTCTLEVHTHTEECYPVEEEPTLGLSYLCGYAAHTHNENCYAANGTMTCTIPEHSHEAACVVEDLDLTADVELASEWEAELAEVEFTGVWAEDLLTVAESQLDYQESKKNCILKNDKLLGYTRYADWYGEYYGEWDDMFVAFCLNYAEITTEHVPTDANTAKWIEKLEEKELYAAAGGYAPVAGDLIFWDSDDDNTADKSGIVFEIKEEDEKTEYKVIAGDVKNDRVEKLTFESGDETIVGYCKLPVNPMTAESWAEAEKVAAMIAQLPEAATVEETFQTLNDSGDKAGYEALRQEVVSRVEAAQTAYDALTDAQKDRVGSIEKLTALQELCGGENWQQFAALEDDGAVITALTADSAEVIRAEKPAEETEETTEETEANEEAPAEEAAEPFVIPDNMVQAGDTIRYTFTASAESYYTDVRYGEARVKLELVLPAAAEQAAFDTAAMTWLEEQALTTEIRTINGAETTCQVLTGYKKLVADETSAIVIPGSFTETAVVKIQNMPHGQQIALILSAAMEHGTWEGTCETHQVAEKLTVAGSTYTAYAPASTEAQLANFEAFQLRIAEVVGDGMVEEDIAALEQEMAEAYKSGAISAAQYEELADLLDSMKGLDYGNIAEPCYGNAWRTMDFDPSYYYGSEEVMLYSFARTASVPATNALAAEVAEEVLPPSDKQIHYHGGEEMDSEDGIYVSKTIAGTDIENVFDITLNIITREVVQEIYKDPNMAVVLVMDVSNTMKENFTSGGGSTRYQAAMTAASNFLTQFAKQSSVLSRVGFVAFNTHAHKIFDMSPCNTTAQANALIEKMGTGTWDNIMKKYVDGDKNRFTNMEAGLKMAQDMLADAPNAHKYVIFITDGFPTTYISSGYTGYNPYNTTDVEHGNTRNTYKKTKFFDVLDNEYMTYGTSYSDPAAIKARQMAVSMKKDGINIFSIGVDVSGQTLSFYNRHSMKNGGFSVVERLESLNYYNTTGYEIGLKHSDLWDPDDVPAETADGYNPAKYPEWEAYKPKEAQYFKNWLKGSESSGIGSGYYYDSNDSAGLSSAFDQIFAKIKELNATSSHLDWVTTDPMSDMGVHEVQAMEFIGFWDLDDNGDYVMVEDADGYTVMTPSASGNPKFSLVADGITGESKAGNLYDNTAEFNVKDQTIEWDLKDSGYSSISMGDTTMFQCSLTYRVRLKNEESAFVEGEIYDTNDTTTLTYRVIEVEGENTVISGQETIDFPIPQVFGYLSELNFLKTDPSGKPVAGAEFTLSHDTVNCGVCRGDIREGEDIVKTVTIADQVATSDVDGAVSFTRIPSGHTYILKETVVPEGYVWNNQTYRIIVAYDQQTLLICDENGAVLTDDNGDPIQWTTASVMNDMFYQLPHTGGMGTSHFTFGGLLMIAAALMYIHKFGRKQRKGGTYRK